MTAPSTQENISHHRCELCSLPGVEKRVIRIVESAKEPPPLKLVWLCGAHLWEFDNREGGFGLA